MIVTRFAPSPTGLLHRGHAASALFAFLSAQREDGRFLLRIEDIDPVRCREPYVEAIFDDLRWLGLSWPEPVRRQSQHMVDYAKALGLLHEKGLIYPCYCTRKEVEAEALAAGYAPQEGAEAEGPIYAGHCRALAQADREALSQERRAVWRLDMSKALRQVGSLRWFDRGRGWIDARPERFGDVVLARKDVPTSYHLSVVVDDALQGVTLVTRGEDLFAATDIHCLLQNLLELPVPDYHHHPLLRDAEGKRFAKRNKSETLQSLRCTGVTLALEEVSAWLESRCSR